MSSTPEEERYADYVNTDDEEDSCGSAEEGNPDLKNYLDSTLTAVSPWSTNGR